MKQAQVERSWSKDRASLVTCGQRHEGLKRFYQRRDEGIRK